MPFKVVQTIENGAICLAVVPENWEKEGTLCWPPRSQASNIMDEHSIPEKTWSTFPCIVKRTCNTYKAARLEVKAMENRTDTEEEVATEVLQQENDVIFDFNHLMHVDGNSTAAVTPITLTTSHNAMADHISLDDVNTSFIVKNDTEEVIKNQAKIMEMLQDLQSTQKKILQQLAKQEVQNNELFNKMADLNVTATTATNSKSSLEERFLPVDTVAELLQLEEELKKPEFQIKYFNAMSSLCSCSSGIKGTKLCYKIIDNFFSRQLFTFVSWSGNSRNQNEKAAFKFCTNIRYIFFSVIHNADPTMSQLGTDNFIKGIIKNSKQRFEALSTPNPKKGASNTAQNAEESHAAESPAADIEVVPPTISVAEVSVHEQNDD